MVRPRLRSVSMIHDQAGTFEVVRGKRGMRHYMLATKDIRRGLRQDPRLRKRLHARNSPLRKDSRGIRPAGDSPAHALCGGTALFIKQHISIKGSMKYEI